MSANIESSVQCKSNSYWEIGVDGSNGKKYKVTFERQFGNRDYDYDYECTCPAFKYKPGYCKHIKAVKDERCGWSRQWDGGNSTDDNKCPKCGGDVEGVLIAV